MSLVAKTISFKTWMPVTNYKRICSSLIDSSFFVLHTFKTINAQMGLSRRKLWKKTSFKRLCNRDIRSAVIAIMYKLLEFQLPFCHYGHQTFYSLFRIWCQWIESCSILLMYTFKGDNMVKLKG